MNFSGAVDFRPKLWSAMRHYDSKKLQADVVAGIVVGIVALPLAIAFGIASGVSPTVGLITAIIGGFMVSAFGGNSVQIGGPTGAFIVIVYGIISRFGLEGLAVATFMAGLILVLMGLFKLGTVIKFIPYPIVVGFTAGIALTILSTQINDFFGLGLKNLPGDFTGKWGVYLRNFDQIDIPTLCVALFSLAIIILTPKISKRLPGALLAIVIVTAGVAFLKSMMPGLEISTIGDRFGAMSTDIPEVQIIEPTVFGDDRGYFMETYQIDEFAAAGIDKPFVQDNQSRSTKGVLRGLHFQTKHTQGKLVRVTLGEVFDVAVDCRPNSKTFGKWVGATLSADNKKMLWIPEGFAHGFVVLSDVAEFCYKCTDVYDPTAEGGIPYDDPTVNVQWPDCGCEHKTSAKDKEHTPFAAQKFEYFEKY